MTRFFSRLPWLPLACASSLLVGAALAGQPIPGTRPASGEKPSTASTPSSAEEEIPPELERAGKAIEAELRGITPDGPRTQRQMRIASYGMMISLADNGLNDRRGEARAESILKADASIREQFAAKRAKWPDPAMHQELALREFLSLESLHALDILNRPTTFPSTRESQLDLARRLEQLVPTVDKMEILERQIAYSESRWELLTQISDLREKQKTPAGLTVEEAKHLPLLEKRLAATDEEYKARVAALASTRPTLADMVPGDTRSFQK